MKHVNIFYSKIDSH